MKYGTQMNPLPPKLRILQDQEGECIIASEYIPANNLIGCAYVIDKSAPFQGGCIPTPLGGFLMHSENPNCMLNTSTPYYILWNILPLYINQPLTINFSIYNLW